MTISSTTRKVGPYTGTGVQVDYPFTFKAFTTADIYAVKLTIATGVETVLALTTDYTVALNDDQNNNPGGILTMNSALSSAYQLTISTVIANLQPTDLTNQGAFYPATITDALDRATIQIQQLAEENDRALMIPISTTGISTELPIPSADQYIGWDSAGTALENKSVVTATGSTNVKFLSNYATLAAALTAIGSSSVTLVIDAGSAVSVDTTIPSNVHVVGAKSGLLTVASGKTLTISGPFEAGALQVFAGTGSVAFSAGTVNEVYPEWWGAVGDGTTVDTAAMTAAVAAFTTVAGISGSIYKINAVPMLSSRTVKNMAIRPYTVTTNTMGFTCSGKSNITFDNVAVDTPNDATRAEYLILGLNCDFFTLKNSSLNFCGIYIDAANDVRVFNNTFVDGWGNHTYDASSPGSGRTDGNNYYAVLIVNYASEYRVNVSNNRFENVWTAIYVDNTNDLTVVGNQITNTADTGIFDRCTSGVTYNKVISNNVLQNIGKTAIKLCDSNNLTAKGHNGICTGNIIHGYSLKLASEAILCINYFDYGVTNVYLEAPAGDRATGIVISDNVITQVSPATAAPFLVGNLDDAVISNNRISNTIATGTFKLEWCFGGVFSGNTVNVAATVLFYRCDGMSIMGNFFRTAQGVGITTTTGSVVIFDNNFVENTATSPAAGVFGVGISTGGTTAKALSFCNNTFQVKTNVEDANDTTDRNAIGVASDANAALACVDGNKVIFANGFRWNKMMFGNLLYPTYYTGIAGVAKYDSGTNVLTLKPTSDRTATDTITATP
jgi:hypothetical protein